MVVFLAWRYMGLRVWQVIVCLLFGFFLAATTAAPEIHHLVTAIVRLTHRIQIMTPMPKE